MSRKTALDLFPCAGFDGGAELPQSPDEWQSSGAPLCGGTRRSLIRAQVEEPEISALLQRPARAEAPVDRAFEHALLVLDGAAALDGEPASPDELLYLGTGRASITLASDQGTRALLIGGAPFAEQVLLWWNVEDDTSRPRIGH